MAITAGLAARIRSAPAVDSTALLAVRTGEAGIRHVARMVAVAARLAAEAGIAVAVVALVAAVTAAAGAGKQSAKVVD